jgi:gamma-glutamyltranspeptidase/glutathione hydrolase
VAAALEQLDALPPGPGAFQRVQALKQATTAAKLSRAPRSAKGTTHISVVDGAGMIVSMTTSNGSCSGVMAGTSGVQLNNMMGESDLHPDGFHAIQPGVRIGSMMAPMLLDLPDGTVVSLGSGGSERIRTALTQVVSSLVDQTSRGTGEVRLAEAIEAPRVHLDAGVLQVEPGLSDAELESLATTGPVNEWSRPDLYFGGVHAVSWRPDGTVTAAGDPRRDGVGLVVPL